MPSCWDCWDVDNMELMGEDDCLKWLRMFFLDLYFRKYMKICTFFVLLFNIPLWAWPLFDFVKIGNGYILAQYGPCALMTLLACMTLIIPLVVEEKSKSLSRTKQEIFWSIDTCSDKLKKNILKRTHFTKYVLVTNLIMAAVNYVVCIKELSHRTKWEIAYQIVYIKEYLSDYSDILILFFYFSIAYFIIPLMAMGFVFQYFILHITFQANMLQERIGRITENFSNSILHVSNEVYQRQVHQRLRFCAMRYAQWKRYTEEFISSLPTVAVICHVLGMLVIISCAAAWNLAEEKYHLLIVTNAMLACCTVLIVTEHGQLMEDECVRIYEAFLSLPWYTFNVKNQKILLFLLMRVSIPYTMTFYETFRFDRRMIVQYWKVFSSVSAVLTNARNSLKKNNAN